MIKLLYKQILKRILFRLSPDFVHKLFMNCGEFFGRFYITRKLFDLVYGYHGKDISRIVDGINYKTPILLSAGFDNDGRLTQILPFLGFGGEEIGSITYKRTIGNKKPWFIRLIKNKSLIVRKGLANEGVDKIIQRLKSRKKFFVHGISVARTNSPECDTIPKGIDDIVNCFKRLEQENVGDYYTLNISCPNAYCGEDFSIPKNLSLILPEIKNLNIKKPLYVKMPINKTWEEFDELLGIIIQNDFDGVIIGNLNKNYDELKYRDEAPEKFIGGLSGKPTSERSNDLIKRTKDKYKEKLTIIGVGGIMSPKDAMKKFELGADLIMLITGMIMEGPHLIREIAKEIELSNH